MQVLNSPHGLINIANSPQYFYLQVAYSTMYSSNLHDGALLVHCKHTTGA